MDSANSYWQARTALEWQIELGVSDCISETPINRYDAPVVPAKVKPIAAMQMSHVAPDVDTVAQAQKMADSATSLDALRDIQSKFDLCDLKKGARNFVFSDGNSKARVMVIGEAPGRDEDMQGKPFVGRAGQLLDRMFDAIKMGREDAENPIYITNILPWRPPQNRDPEPEEIAMMLPFVRRHVALVDPDVLVLMGNIPCRAILGRQGITRMRGNWDTAWDKPVLPMFHPAYLLRNPAAKRHAWADLLALQARLRGQ